MCGSQIVGWHPPVDGELIFEGHETDQKITDPMDWILWNQNRVAPAHLLMIRQVSVLLEQQTEGAVLTWS